MTRRSVPARWLLLCALALAVVAMHHVPADHGPVVAASASMSGELHAGLPMPGHDGGHSPLHDCLAVLTAAVALLLAVVLLCCRATGAVVVRQVPGRRRGARPPPPRSGRLLLAAHCVLRI
ncbi:hypothetical protein Amsp01_094800 [Amycolatopsis sp. NBRC 101858]|uniref:hypothetical protein n=1 Tax=Amycolatopsis sp. NBRC 101858 TaxID=3032200 RepID=UPI0024A3CBD0|nr:hypothetical protein [Amycolatopsis sp. NBRC 101858]GLY43457.1 hypothetical protein Amsp01_094800 [Amycolatopsis sp. NBRC 101858]